MKHHLLTGYQAAHAWGFRSDTDPALDPANEVQPNSVWVEVDGSDVLVGVHVRNQANTGWEALTVSATWASITGKPTDLAGYGITDAASDSELATEASTRASADSAEATARASADSAEATTRAAADTALDGRVSTLESNSLDMTDTQAANTGLMGPASGSPAAPTFRAPVVADIPNLPASKITSGVFPIARLATGTADGTKFIRDDGTLAVPPGSGGGGPSWPDTWYDPRDATYGGTGDGSVANESPAIQAAIDAAYAAGGGTVVFAAGTTWKLQTGLVVKTGVRLVGEVASASSNAGLPKLLWNGTAAADYVVQIPGQGQNIQMHTIEGLAIEGQTGSRPNHLVVYDVNSDTTTSKVDFGTWLQRCAFARCAQSAVLLRGGVTNLHLRDCRWDHCSGWGVEIDANTGSWLGVIDGEWTYDTGTEAETSPKGFIYINGTTAVDDSLYPFSFSGGKIEVNKALVSPATIFYGGVNTSISQKVQHMWKLSNIWFAAGSSPIAAGANMMGFSAATDDFLIVYDLLRVSFTWNHVVNNMVSTNDEPPVGKQLAFGVIAPHMYASPGSEEQRVNIVADIVTRHLALGAANMAHNLRNEVGTSAFQQFSGAPTAPGAGITKFWFKDTDGAPRYMGSDGVEHSFSSSGLTAAITMYAAADEFTLNSTSLTTPTGIGAVTLPSGNAGVYLVEWLLYLTFATTTATLGCVVNLTSGSFTKNPANYIAEGMNGSPTTGSGGFRKGSVALGTALANTTFGNTQSSTARSPLLVRVIAEIGSTGPVLTLQINGSTTGNIVVKEGSYSRYMKLT